MRLLFASVIGSRCRPAYRTGGGPHDEIFAVYDASGIIAGHADAGSDPGIQMGSVNRIRINKRGYNIACRTQRGPTPRIENECRLSKGQGVTRMSCPLDA